MRHKYNCLHLIEVRPPFNLTLIGCFTWLFSAMDGLIFYQDISESSGTTHSARTSHRRDVPSSSSSVWQWFCCYRHKWYPWSWARLLRLWNTATMVCSTPSFQMVASNNIQPEVCCNIPSIKALPTSKLWIENFRIWILQYTSSGDRQHRSQNAKGVVLCPTLRCILMICTRIVTGRLWSSCVNFVTSKCSNVGVVDMIPLAPLVQRRGSAQYVALHVQIQG